MRKLLGIVRSTTGDEPKCVDCKRYKPIAADSVLLYSSPKHHCTAITDIVTGKTIDTDCYAMRHEWCECGPNAVLFKAKDTSAKEEKPAPDPDPVVVRVIGKALIAFLVGLGLLAILLALAFWRYGTSTPQSRVIQTGKVSEMREVSVKDGFRRVTARTRLLATGKSSLWQVEVSPDNWTDCGNDCGKTLLKAIRE